MTGWLEVVRTPRYDQDLEAIGEFIARDNPDAALVLLTRIEDQVRQLGDPNFPRRRGRLTGTMELVAHPNYIVLLKQTATRVTALAVMHVARQYP